MEATVGSLIKLDKLKGATVIAGARGLGNVVRCVDIMEVPDVAPWLRQGELLLTTAYAIRDDSDAQCRLIEAMAKAGAAALGIKIGRFLGAVPERMVELSEEYGLPIIDIPKHIPYIDITAAIMERLLDYHQSHLQQSVEIHQQLTKLVVGNRGIQALAEAIAALGDCQVTIQDERELIVAKAGSLDSCAKLTKTLPVIFENAVIGQVALTKDAAKIIELDAVLLEHAATIVALEMMKLRVQTETSIRLRADFIHDLLAGDFGETESVLNRSRYLGIDLEDKLGLIVVDIDDFQRYAAANSEEVVARTKQSLYNAATGPAGKKTMITYKSDKLVVLVPLTASDAGGKALKEARAFADRLHEILGREVPQVTTTIGVGGICSGLQQLKSSYIEAQDAIRIGRVVFGKARVISYHELGIYPLLFSLKDHPTLDSLYGKWLGRIIEHDRQKGTDLLTTLEIYLETNGNAQETADRLYIHRNTLRYRLAKLVELTDGGIYDNNSRLQCLVAVKLWRLN